MSSTDTLGRVEAKLTRLQAEMDAMSARREDPYHMIGWVRGGIEDALAMIAVAS